MSKELDRTLAFTALLQMSPRFGKMPPEESLPVTDRLAAEMSAANPPDRWAFAREWIARELPAREFRPMASKDFGKYVCVSHPQSGCLHSPHITVYGDGVWVKNPSGTYSSGHRDCFVAALKEEAE